MEVEKTNQSIFMKSAVNNLNQSFETYPSIFERSNAHILSHKGREHLLKAKEALEDTKKYIKANKLRPISSKNLKEFQKIYDEYDIFLKASGK